MSSNEYLDVPDVIEYVGPPDAWKCCGVLLKPGDRIAKKGSGKTGVATIGKGDIHDYLTGKRHKLFRAVAPEVAVETKTQPKAAKIKSADPLE